MGMMCGEAYEFIWITLMSDEKTLKQRAKERDNNQNPTFVVLEQTKKLEGTIKIETTNLTIDEVVEEVHNVIIGAKQG